MEILEDKKKPSDKKKPDNKLSDDLILDPERNEAVEISFIIIFSLLLLVQIRFSLWHICRSKEMRNIYNVLFTSFVITTIIIHLGTLIFNLILTEDNEYQWSKSGGIKALTLEYFFFY